MKVRMVIMDKTDFFFNSIDVLISHVVNFLDNPTPLKVQKSLYFLWAFYAATYGNIDYQEKTDFSDQEKYPRSLFEADFEAWSYGPVINSVFAEYHKTNGFEGVSDKYVESEISDKNEKEVWSFIDDLLTQINKVNDFGLVERSHQDSAWRNAYKEGQRHCKMDADEIKRDYVNYVNEQSKI